jgi:glucose-1-phosphate cytidylyltransferase
MKVVLFCGGLGVRMREVSEEFPKPMLRVGDRPILWHIMRYYAHYGYKDFILCLGYKAETVKRYFLECGENHLNDFVLSRQGFTRLSGEMDDWTITLVNTGLNTSIGQRLKRVQHLLEGEEMFLANYGDNLTDAPLDEMVQDMKDDRSKAASFLCVRPSQSFHLISCRGEGPKCSVDRISMPRESDIWINGGYFVLRPEVFDCLGGGRELVPDGLNLLRERDQLVAWRYEGFWASMDTPKEMYQLNEVYSSGAAKWAKWERT